MMTRIGFLKLATFVAVAAAGLAPATAQAQNRGQLVQAVAKLNQAQLAFVKRLAEDQTFSTQFDQAMSSGNFDAAASLAASAAGVAKSDVSVGSGGGRDDHHNDAASASTASKNVFQLASFTLPRNERKPMTTGYICIKTIIAEGCIKW
jgi:hypothetical protein